MIRSWGIRCRSWGIRSGSWGIGGGSWVVGGWGRGVRGRVVGRGVGDRCRMVGGGVMGGRVMGSGVVRGGMVRLLDGVVFTDGAFVFDIGVVLLVFVNVIIDDLGTAIGKLNGVLSCKRRYIVGTKHGQTENGSTRKNHAKCHQARNEILLVQKAFII